jgi:hypothetical protein
MAESAGSGNTLTNNNVSGNTVITSNYYSVVGNTFGSVTVTSYPEYYANNVGWAETASQVTPQAFVLSPEGSTGFTNATCTRAGVDYPRVTTIIGSFTSGNNLSSPDLTFTFSSNDDATTKTLHTYIGNIPATISYTITVVPYLLGGTLRAVSFLKIGSAAMVYVDDQTNDYSHDLLFTITKMNASLPNSGFMY